MKLTDSEEYQQALKLEKPGGASEKVVELLEMRVVKGCASSHYALAHFISTVDT